MGNVPVVAPLIKMPLSPFCDWLLSFSIRFSSLVYVITYVNTSLLILKEFYHTPYLFIHSLIEGHLGSFQFLDIINKGSMNIVEHVSLLHV